MMNAGGIEELNSTRLRNTETLYDVINSGSRHDCIIGVHKAP